MKTVQVQSRKCYWFTTRTAACAAPWGQMQGPVSCSFRRGHLLVVGAAKRTPTKKGEVSYGRDWYTQTRENARRFKTVKEELEWRRKANWEANNGRDRKDLYTDNWAGDKWKGGGLNILTVILLISVLVPLAGLWFAYTTFGTLWG